MTVSIPAPNGGWKEASNGVGRRREAALLPQSHPPMLPAELPAYMPAPMQPVVASATEVVLDAKGASSSKPKKGRSMRRCMDREKHSKAEQKRRGEMKMLFDQLQDISQCVYKDRIHILTLAIQTIQRQQDTITELQTQAKDGGKGRGKMVKREQASYEPSQAVDVSSGFSTPASSVDSVHSKRAAVAAELDCPPATLVKQEDLSISHSPKRQRMSPDPRHVVDLSNEVSFSAPTQSSALHESQLQQQSGTVSSLATSYANKPLPSSFSSSSLSTFVCSSADAQGHYSYLMDEQLHAPYHGQHADEPVVSKLQLPGHTIQPTPNAAYPSPPSMSPVFSFTAHAQQWWPSVAESNKQ